MAGFTADGQVNETVLDARDGRFRRSWRKRCRDRAAIPMPEALPGANGWQSGRTAQTRLEELDFPADPSIETPDTSARAPHRHGAV